MQANGPGTTYTEAAARCPEYKPTKPNNKALKWLYLGLFKKAFGIRTPRNMHTNYNMEQAWLLLDERGCSQAQHQQQLPT